MVCFEENWDANEDWDTEESSKPKSNGIVYGLLNSQKSLIKIETNINLLIIQSLLTL